MHIRYIIIYLCPVWLHRICSHYLIKSSTFGKSYSIYDVCVLILSSNVSEKFLILRRIERDIVMNVQRYSSKLSVIRVGLKWNLNILHRFSKNILIWNFINIPLVGVDLFLAYRQTTDRHDETNSWFSKFCGGSKQENNIRALSGIRTPDPSKSAAADLRLRPNEQPPGSTPSFIRTIKTRKFHWVRRVACAGCTR